MTSPFADVWKLVPLEATSEQLTFNLDTEATAALYSNMVVAAPTITPLVRLDDAAIERLTEIMVGQNLPGVEGAMLRFLARCDFENARGWINEEIARGTGASARFDVVITVASFVLAHAIMSVKERGHATRDVLSKIPEAVHNAIHRAELSAKAAAGPTLRVVKEQDEDGS